MSLLLLLGITILLLLVISLGSELLARGAEILEHKFGAGFVGSVILGFITMLPELIFVMVAVMADEIGVAVGSAIGGNILLFTLGYGMVILIAYLKHGEIIELKFTMRDDLWYLTISSFYLLIASFDRRLELRDGVLLVIMYFVFVGHQYWESRRYGDHHEDRVEIRRFEWVKSYVFMAVGAAVIVFSAEPFVHTIIELSTVLGVSALFLALVISPIASEMPEKISAFVLARKSMKGAEIAIANFIGSKVQTGTLLFGMMIILEVFLDNGRAYLNVTGSMIQIFLAVFTTIVGVFITFDLKLKMRENFLVVLLYVVSIFMAYIFEVV